MFPPGKPTQPFCLFNKENKIIINHAQFPSLNQIKITSRQLFSPSLRFVDCSTLPFSCVHICMYTWMCIHNISIPILSVLPNTHICCF